MYILKAILTFIIVALFPAAIVYLLFSGFLQLFLLLFVLLAVALICLYSDKFILMFLGAREIIDADNQSFFQVLKTETYKELEDMPKVYVYTGHKVKAFVLNLRGEWSIVIDRKLLENVSEIQSRALVKYLLRVKNTQASKSQTIGMGTSAAIIKFNYWIWQRVIIRSKGKALRLCVFLSLIMLKPLIEIILKISVNRESIFAEDELKPIYLQVDKLVTERSFTEFMLLHLQKDTSLKGCIIEYLESFPLLENCKFKEVVL